jgi:four helix bundle protein
MGTSSKSHENLLVWQKTVLLPVEIYMLTESFPADERFGLVSQMRRCAVSIPSNSAGGEGGKFKRTMYNFLRIAYESKTELETQLVIAKNYPLVMRYNTKQ